MPRLTIRELNAARRAIANRESVYNSELAAIKDEIINMDIYQMCTKINKLEDRVSKTMSRLTGIKLRECVCALEDAIQERLGRMNEGVLDGKLVLKYVKGEARIVT